MRTMTGMSGAFLGLMVLALVAQPLHAQQGTPPISLEARGGYTFPLGSFSDDLGAESDFGYGAAVTFNVTPSFGIYGGWSRDVFQCEACGPGDQIRASGFEMGGKFILPSETRAHPWVKAGLLAPRSVLRAGASRFESDRHLGFQAAVGLDAPLTETVSLSPALRFNNFTSEFEGIEGVFEPFQPKADFRYLSFDIGLHVHLR
jgi:hypothetical protein